MEHIFLATAATATGLARSGLAAIGTVTTPLLTYAYVAQQAAGITTILLILGDLGAIMYYRKKCNVKILLRMVPLSIVGITIGFLFGKSISNKVYLTSIAILSAIALIILIRNYIRNRKTNFAEPHKGIKHYTLLISCGITAGITTVLSNNSNVFTYLFLTELSLKKEQLIGTQAWHFFCINSIKLVMHFFYWRSIPVTEIPRIILFVPFVYLGLIGGIAVVKKMNESVFHLCVLGFSFLSFILIIIRRVTI